MKITEEINISECKFCPHYSNTCTYYRIFYNLKIDHTLNYSETICPFNDKLIEDKLFSYLNDEYLNRLTIPNVFLDGRLCLLINSNTKFYFITYFKSNKRMVINKSSFFIFKTILFDGNISSFYDIYTILKLIIN